jgi:hypothetical protein
MVAKRKDFDPFKKQQRESQRVKREARKETAIKAVLTGAVLKEEKVLSSSFRGLGGKGVREVRVAETLDFMPSALLSLMNIYDEAFDKETHQLLTHVVQGEQDQAEILLKSNPNLLFEKGTITDLSKRTFKNITAFQYALWALDWHMWKMLLKYMLPEEALVQYQELEDKGTVHGKHFSLTPLIEALNSYVENYSGWYAAQNWTAMATYWYRQVGGAQLLLPAHVAQEYCHPSRSFSPVPNFEEANLPRSLKLYGEQEEWYTATYNGGWLGEKFGVCRFSWEAADTFRVYIYSYAPDLMMLSVKADADAVQCLSSTRQQQLAKLRSDLLSSLDKMPQP